MLRLLVWQLVLMSLKIYLHVLVLVGCSFHMQLYHFSFIISSFLCEMVLAKRSFKCVVEEELGKLPYFVIYALLEWMMIAMLFIDGFLSFAATTFAKFFELKSPCLLCTRIDHVLLDRNHEFYYNNSICESHQKNVSNLAYCHVHKKLTEIKKMCEGCLLSFATQKDSDCDTYKSLVGILHKDLDLLVDDTPDIPMTVPPGKREDLAQQLYVEKSVVDHCSCCGAPLKVKPSLQPRGKHPAHIAVAPAPSPRAPFASSLRNEDSRVLELPHLRYSERKYTDTEDDGGSNTINRDKQLRDDIKSATAPMLTDPDEEKTPNFARGNKFFGIPLSDSAQNSPRWTLRFPKKSMLERTENAPDSTEGNATQETESENIFHHLNKQVRLDRKSLMDLYMELDEERSASAEAAYNAMAMITRLQGEKASVQMEALQYQRMMEEQAEYDEEALQATKDLLTEREKQIQELEAELEEFRNKYGSLRRDRYNGQEYSSDNEERPKYNHQRGYDSSSQGSNSGPGSPHDSVNGGRSLNKKGMKTQFVPKKDLDNNLEASSDNNVEEDRGQDKLHKLTKELLDIHERLKALEADDEYLKHVSQTLPDGSEGITVLADISSNLNKLQSFVMMPFSKSDPPKS